VSAISLTPGSALYVNRAQAAPLFNGLQDAAPASDGAFDSKTGYDAVAKRHPCVAVIIPPRSTVPVAQCHRGWSGTAVQTIAKHGRTSWLLSSGYSRRSLVETAMYRYKTIVGRRLHAWTLLNQRTEAKIGCYVLNQMTSLGIPISVRIK
jgi:hypothetical protein